MFVSFFSSENATIAKSPNVTRMYPVNDNTIKLAMLHLMDTFGMPEADSLCSSGEQ